MMACGAAAGSCVDQVSPAKTAYAVEGLTVAGGELDVGSHLRSAERASFAEAVADSPDTTATSAPPSIRGSGPVVVVVSHVVALRSHHLFRPWSCESAVVALFVRELAPAESSGSAFAPWGSEPHCSLVSSPAAALAAGVVPSCRSASAHTVAVMVGSVAEGLQLSDRCTWTASARTAAASVAAEDIGGSHSKGSHLVAAAEAHIGRCSSPAQATGTVNPWRRIAITVVTERRCRGTATWYVVEVELQT
jgi:hypothetical protein